MAKYLGRTKKGEYTQSDVRKAAMRTYWHNVAAMAKYCSCFPPQIFDHRFCFDNEVEREYWVIVRNRNYYADARMMQDKRKERMQNRKGCEFVGILQNPIVIDWQKHHRFHSHRVYADHISWGVRNHWAKNEKDVRILAIFRKWDDKRNIEDLRNQRNAIVESFQKHFKNATMDSQNEMNEVCYRISKLMNDENSIEVTFMRYDTIRYTKEQVDELKAKGVDTFYYKEKADGYFYHNERVEKKGRVILSDNDEHNRFFLFAIGFHKHLCEYTPFYHIHDHYPHWVHRIYKSLDIIEGAYINQFVDDYVYNCNHGELGIMFGNMKIDSWNTDYNCVLTSSVHANGFSICPALISKNHKEVIRYEGEAWYHTNRKVGEYQ